MWRSKRSHTDFPLLYNFCICGPHYGKCDLSPPPPLLVGWVTHYPVSAPEKQALPFHGLQMSWNTFCCRTKRGESEKLSETGWIWWPSKACARAIWWESWPVFRDNSNYCSDNLCVRSWVTSWPFSFAAAQQPLSKVAEWYVVLFEGLVYAIMPWAPGSGFVLW